MEPPSDDLHPLNIRWLSIDDFEYLCFDLARELMTYGEPIPDYSTRDDSLLKSALGVPKQTFDRKLLYPTLSKQAAALFYSLIKNHPFRNGNKRIAVMGLLAFLSLNKKWINIHPLTLYNMACEVSESDPKNRDSILEIINDKIGKHLVGFPAV